MTFYILVLICSGQDCTQDNARAVFSIPARNILECNMVLPAQTAARTLLQEGEYLVTKCVRSNIDTKGGEDA